MAAALLPVVFLLSDRVLPRQEACCFVTFRHAPRDPCGRRIRSLFNDGCGGESGQTLLVEKMTIRGAGGYRWRYRTEFVAAQSQVKSKASALIPCRASAGARVSAGDILAWD